MGWTSAWFVRRAFSWPHRAIPSTCRAYRKAHGLTTSEDMVRLPWTDSYLLSLAPTRLRYFQQLGGRSVQERGQSIDGGGQCCNRCWLSPFRLCFFVPQ